MSKESKTQAGKLQSKETRISETSGGQEHIPLDQGINFVHQKMEQAFTASPLLIRTYMLHLAKTRGKGIRAQSLLICSTDKEGNIAEGAVSLGAAVEVLHLATLVHDDVIDDADLRRGHPTLQKQYGKKTAVICGDYLLCLAAKLAGDVPDRKKYVEFTAPDYITKICLGELYQHMNNGNVNLSVRQYLKIIAGKTAALFEACYYGGAVLAGKEGRELSLYAKLGKYTGMIFQLTDDCMDLEVTETVAQKPVGWDLEQKVITLPLIHAFRQRISLKEKVEQGTAQREEVRAAVISAGGISFTHMVAQRYFDKASAIISSLDEPEAKKQQLTLILKKAFRVFS